MLSLHFEAKAGSPHVYCIGRAWKGLYPQDLYTFFASSAPPLESVMDFFPSIHGLTCPDGTCGKKKTQEPLSRNRGIARCVGLTSPGQSPGLDWPKS